MSALVARRSSPRRSCCTRSAGGTRRARSRRRYSSRDPPSPRTTRSRSMPIMATPGASRCRCSRCSSISPRARSRTSRSGTRQAVWRSLLVTLVALAVAGVLVRRIVAAPVRAWAARRGRGSASTRIAAWRERQRELLGRARSRIAPAGRHGHRDHRGRHAARAVAGAAHHRPAGLNETSMMRHHVSADSVVRRDRPDLVYLPHPHYAEMRDALLADPVFERDYEIWPAAARADMGAAVRRDGPYADSLRALFAARAAETAARAVPATPSAPADPRVTDRAGGFLKPRFRLFQVPPRPRTFPASSGGHPCSASCSARRSRNSRDSAAPAAAGAALRRAAREADARRAAEPEDERGEPRVRRVAVEVAGEAARPEAPGRRPAGAHDALRGRPHPPRSRCPTRAAARCSSLAAAPRTKDAMGRESADAQIPMLPLAGFVQMLRDLEAAGVTHFAFDRCPRCTGATVAEAAAVQTVEDAGRAQPVQGRRGRARSSTSSTPSTPAHRAPRGGAGSRAAGRVAHHDRRPEHCTC